MSEAEKPLTHRMTRQLSLFFLQHPAEEYDDSEVLKTQAVDAGLDPVAVRLLATYARCLCLEDSEASWDAQCRFHRAQLARAGGGTQAMKRGAELRSLLARHEASQP
ncbi:MAG: hypothetical protein ACX93N_08130 [Pseudohaliea sp.]